MQLLPGQQEPDPDYVTWILHGGRGAGKTVAGAEWVARRIEAGKHIAVIGMGLMDVKSLMLPYLLRTERVRAAEKVVSSTAEGRIMIDGCGISLLGVQHIRSLNPKTVDYAWLDEPFAGGLTMTNWSELQDALKPDIRRQVCITGEAFSSEAARLIDSEGGTLRTRCATAANAANLPPAFLDELKACGQWDGD